MTRLQLTHVHYWRESRVSTEYVDRYKCDCGERKSIRNYTPRFTQAHENDALHVTPYDLLPGFMSRQ